MVVNQPAPLQMPQAPGSDTLPPSATRVHEDWENFIQNFRSQLESIYFPDTVEEWMEENVNPYMDRLREFVRDYREIIRLNAKPKAL